MVDAVMPAPIVVDAQTLTRFDELKRIPSDIPLAQVLPFLTELNQAFRQDIGLDVDKEFHNVPFANTHSNSTLRSVFPQRPHRSRRSPNFDRTTLYYSDVAAFCTDLISRLYNYQFGKQHQLQQLASQILGSISEKELLSLGQDPQSAERFNEAAFLTPVNLGRLSSALQVLATNLPAFVEAEQKLAQPQKEKDADEKLVTEDDLDDDQKPETKTTQEPQTEQKPEEITKNQLAKPLGAAEIAAEIAAGTMAPEEAAKQLARVKTTLQYGLLASMKAQLVNEGFDINTMPMADLESLVSGYVDIHLSRLQETNPADLEKLLTKNNMSGLVRELQHLHTYFNVSDVAIRYQLPQTTQPQTQFTEVTPAVGANIGQEPKSASYLKQKLAEAGLITLDASGNPNDLGKLRSTKARLEALAITGHSDDWIQFLSPKDFQTLFGFEIKPAELDQLRPELTTYYQQLFAEFDPKGEKGLAQFQHIFPAETQDSQQHTQWFHQAAARTQAPAKLLQTHITAEDLVNAYTLPAQKSGQEVPAHLLISYEIRYEIFTELHLNTVEVEQVGGNPGNGFVPHSVMNTIRTLGGGAQTSPGAAGAGEGGPATKGLSAVDKLRQYVMGGKPEGMAANDRLRAATDAVAAKALGTLASAYMTPVGGAAVERIAQKVLNNREKILMGLAAGATGLTTAFLMLMNKSPIIALTTGVGAGVGAFLGSVGGPFGALGGAIGGAGVGYGIGSFIQNGLNSISGAFSSLTGGGGAGNILTNPFGSGAASGGGGGGILGSGGAGAAAGGGGFGVVGASVAGAGIIGVTTFMTAAATVSTTLQPLPTTDSSGELSPYVTIEKRVSPKIKFENAELPATADYSITIKANKGYDLKIRNVVDVMTVKLNTETRGSDPTPTLPTRTTAELVPAERLVDGEIILNSGEEITLNPYSQTFDSAFRDSNVSNKVEILFSAQATPELLERGEENKSGENLNASGAEVICIGECPQNQNGCWPVDGRITQLPFGSHSHGKSDSFDIGANRGVPVYTPFAGTVKINSLGGGFGSFGKYVVLDTGSERFVFAHLSKIDSRLSNDKEIPAGHPIGEVGSTGGSAKVVITGPHLHYEVSNTSGQFYNTSSSRIRNFVPDKDVKLYDPVRTCYTEPVQ
ncbi:MAG TPA: peptidoglycan DD-metalloendopeptidase family protein [Vitreimonas sp.]|nr:peptidoglycan DD-metalloendopeptidase family protein [Vitreimonas sp.]